MQECRQRRELTTGCHVDLVIDLLDQTSVSVLAPIWVELIREWTFLLLEDEFLLSGNQGGIAKWKPCTE